MSPPMTGRLLGKVFLVTGGGTGIGRAICLSAAREGADVCIACHASVEGARAVKREILSLGRRAAVLRADIGIARQARALVGRAFVEMGALHVLVNNAAIVRCAPFLEYRLEDWEATFAINLRAAFLCARGFAAVSSTYRPSAVCSRTPISAPTTHQRLAWTCSPGARPQRWGPGGSR